MQPIHLIKFRPSKRSVALLAAVALVISFLSFSLALTLSKSTKLIPSEAAWDVRLKGLNSNQRATPDFEFREDRAAAVLSKIQLELEENGKSRELFVSGNSVAYKDLGGPARVRSIEVKPRLFLLIPSLDFGLLYVGAITFLLVLIVIATYSKSKDLVYTAPAAAFLVILTCMLAQNRLDYWNRAFWLWFAALLLTTGALLWSAFASHSDEIHQTDPSEIHHKSPLLSHVNLCIAAILLLALYLRFHGLDFGLPALFHPDEGRKIRIARTMALTGDLNPHYFLHPSFLLYATAALTWIKNLFYGSAPHFNEVAYLGRSVSAVLGGFSVVILFLAGRRLFGNRAALIAAAILAVAPLHVVSSRYIKEDAAMVFFALVSFYFAVLALTKGNFARSVLIGAFFGGVAASSKYSGMLAAAFTFGVFLNLALHKLADNWPKFFAWVRPLLFAKPQNDLSNGRIFVLSVASILLFVTGFLLVSPYAVLDSEQFLTDFMSEKGHMERGHGVPISALSYFWTYHFKFSILPAFQYIAALLAILGAGFMLRRLKAQDILVICAVLLFYLPAEYVNAKPPPQPERYIVPCIPFLALALGAFLSAIYGYSRRHFGRAGEILIGIIFITAFALPLEYSWSHGASIKHDTRDEAAEWIKKNTSHHASFLIDWKFYGPAQLEKSHTVMDFKDKRGAKILRGISVESLSETPFDYLVISSLFYGRYLDPLYRTHNLSKRIRKLFEELPPAAYFSRPRYNYGFHNPDIYIFAIPKTGLPHEK